MAELEFVDKKKDWQLHLPANEAKWLTEIFPKLIIANHSPVLFSELQKNYEKEFATSFSDFTKSKIWNQLRQNGLLVL